MANSGVHVMWHRFRCARGGGARMRHAGAYTKQGRYKYSGENDRFHRRASHQGSQPTRGSGVQRALVAVYSRHGMIRRIRFYADMPLPSKHTAPMGRCQRE